MGQTLEQALHRKGYTNHHMKKYLAPLVIGKMQHDVLHIHT